MSAREWKPGDVGTSQYGRVFNTDRGWVFDDNSGYTTADEIRGFRPLVVIDPESLEDQEALAKALVEAMYHAGDKRSAAAGVMPATVGRALNALADPKPRIEEPTGLGAVVELVGGGVLVRTPAPTDDLAVWADMSGDFYPWSALDVAKVLHEGWSE